MSGADHGKLEEIHSAIEQASDLLRLTGSRSQVWPVLTAFGDVLPDSVIAFRVATGARRSGELDCRATMLPNNIDPYRTAVANELVTRTGHPVHSLLAEVQELCPIDSYGIDFGVVRGFKKIWPFFPASETQQVSRLSRIPSMPPSVAANLEFFERHGLNDKAGLIGIDYEHTTINVYFVELASDFFGPESIRSLHRDAGLPEPSAHLVEYCRSAFAMYVTLNWTTSAIERICFPVMTSDPLTLSVPIDSTVERFVRAVPFVAGSRRFIYAATSAADGEYYKLQSFYQWERPKILDLMRVADPAENTTG